MDADGDFVIAWTDNTQDGSFYGIYAQRYTADGSPAGSEFLVNTQPLSAQLSPSVAMDADGDFVIAWQSYIQDGGGFGVYAQRYTADGIEAGSEFLVNTETSDFQESPSVAMDADGDFVIAWQSYGQDTSDSYGVYAQRYTADGSTAGSEFQVNTYTTNKQSNPSIAMDADGDFVIAWQSKGQDDISDSNSYGIFAQLYTADGSTVGSEFPVNTGFLNNQRDSSVAMDADGDFVIAWASDDDSSYEVYAQRYTADGSKAGGEFQVNTETSSLQESPSVAMDSDGDFVIAWQSLN